MTATRAIMPTRAGQSGAYPARGAALWPMWIIARAAPGWPLAPENGGGRTVTLGGSAWGGAHLAE